MSTSHHLGLGESSAMNISGGSRRFGPERRAMHKARQAWRNAGYPPELIEKLAWDRRYSVVEIGDAGYAFSNYADYVAALKSAWEMGHVPVHGPGSVAGIDLPAVAPRLRGLDGDVELHLQDSLGGDPGTR